MHCHYYRPRIASFSLLFVVTPFWYSSLVTNFFPSGTIDSKADASSSSSSSSSVYVDESISLSPFSSSFTESFPLESVSHTSKRRDARSASSPDTSTPRPRANSDNDSLPATQLVTHYPTLLILGSRSLSLMSASCQELSALPLIYHPLLSSPPSFATSHPLILFATARTATPALARLDTHQSRLCRELERGREAPIRVYQSEKGCWQMCPHLPLFELTLPVCCTLLETPFSFL
mmetsp:Transcript_14409/g.36748  ORF Transcript_14409/g.36748 Transcript_14409/m.36748 type:complete len:234 (+) Transcript_14409:236-937(+)